MIKKLSAWQRLLILLGLCALTPSVSAQPQPVLQSQSPPAQELTFYSAFEQVALSEIIAGFAAASGIVVHGELISQDHIKVRMIEAIDKGVAPDIVMVPADHLGLYAHMRYSPILPEWSQHELVPGAWRAGYVDGKYYGAPFVRGNFLVLYYNRELVKEPASTWDDMLKQHSQLAVNGVKAITWDYRSRFWLLPFIAAFGGMPMEEGKITLDTPATIAGLEFYKSLADQGLIELGCAYTCAFEMFAKGEAAYTINGDWAYRELAERLGDKLGVALLPRIGDKPLPSTHSAYAIAFPGDGLNGPKRAALLRFLNFIHSSAAQKELFDKIRVLPVEQEAYAHALANATPDQQVMIEQLSLSRPLPNDRAMVHVWSAMGKGFLRHQAGLMTAAEAAAVMQRLAEREMAREYTQ